MPTNTLSRVKKWNEKQLVDAVSKAKSLRSVLGSLGLRPTGGNYVHVGRYIKVLGIDTSHFQGKGWNRGLTGIGKAKYALSDILIKDSTFQSYKLKMRLFKEKLKFPQCEECGWAKIALDGRIPVELDHINGDRFDNRLENLRVLCPNCHSLKSTHRGLNQKRVG